MRRCRVEVAALPVSVALWAWCVICCTGAPGSEPDVCWSPSEDASPEDWGDSEEADASGDAWPPLPCSSQTFWMFYDHGSGWPRYFPGSLFRSADDAFLYYSVTFLPSPVPPDDWAEPRGPLASTVAWYRMNLADYSIVPLARLPGPPMDCGELWDAIASNLPAGMWTTGAVGAQLLAFGDDNRYCARLVPSDRAYACEPWLARDWWCPSSHSVPCLDWDIDSVLSGVDDPALRLLVPVGILEDGASPTRRLASEAPVAALYFWWDRDTFADLAAERLRCDDMDSVHPGRNPLCPQQGGPCCRCTADADCAGGYRCRGRTADGTAYCLRD